MPSQALCPSNRIASRNTPKFPDARGIARKIAERSKTLADHAGRRTIKGKDIKLAVDEWKKQ